MSHLDDHFNYIESLLIKQLAEQFYNEDLVDFKILHSGGFDGFMSELFTIDIKTISKLTKKEKEYHLIVKLMKSGELFRVSSKCYVQFPNEIFIYSEVLPYYEKIAKNSKSSINVEDWAPKVYMSKFGIVEGFGNGSRESILVMENLKPSGYRCGPLPILDRQHLLMMIKPIAEFHSFTYALRIKNDPVLDNFIKEINPLPFVRCRQEKTDSKWKLIADGLSSKNGSSPAAEDYNFYEVLYKLAFERFYTFLDKIKANYDQGTKNIKDDDFFKDLNLLRAKYFDKPEKILEFIRLAAVNDPDDVFPAILHGDYNRNNVLFQYDSEENFDNPKDIKMIDFQELRYSTTAIDLSFFMYMNMDPKDRESDFWMELLHKYHEVLISSMASILQVNLNHDSLIPYRFEAFYEHFTKYAFYGVMVCLHFLPWQIGTPEEIEKLGTEFANDMYGENFRKASLESGGNVPDNINLKTVKHAHQMGYIKNLL